MKQAFFGDIDDKYLPTFHSLRLVLRAGLIFLGSYVLVYSMIAIAQNYAGTLLYTAIGGQTIDFWVAWEPLTDLAQRLPFEPLRLCLLAVAFCRCLELFQQRVDAAPAPQAPQARRSPSRRPDEGRPRGSARGRLISVVVALAFVALSAAGLRLSETSGTDDHLVRGRVGETVTINEGLVTVDDVRVGTALKSNDQIRDRTNGMFVVVHVDAEAAGSKKLGLQTARLLAADE